MAEPLVLASVEIDESGVVRAAQYMNSALDSSEEKFQNVENASKSTVDQLNHMVDHMYSLSSITRIVTHSFGLLAIAIAAKQFIEGTETFQNLKESAHELGEVLTGVTDAAGATAGAVDKILASAGLADKQAEDLAKTNDAIDKLNEARERLLQPVASGNFLDQVKSMFTSGPENAAAIAKIDDGLAKLQGRLTEVVGAGGERGDFYKAAGIVPPEDLAEKISQIDAAEDFFNARLATNTITAERYKEAIDHLEASRSRLLNTEKEADLHGKAASHQAVGPAAADNPLAFAGIASPQEIDAAISRTLVSLQALNVALASGTITEDQASDGFSRLRQSLKDSGVAAQEVMNIFGNLGLDIQENTSDLTDEEQRVISLTQTMGEYANTFSAAQGMISAAVSAGVVSRGAAAKINMAIQAVEAIQKGMMEEAEAVASAASFDAPAAALHHVAAGLFFATAAFQGVGALGGGGGPSGGGARGGGAAPRSSASATQAPGERVTNLQVIVEGHVIGQDAWLREAIVDIQRNLGAGAGGGGF